MLLALANPSLSTNPSTSLTSFTSLRTNVKTNDNPVLIKTPVVVATEDIKIDPQVYDLIAPAPPKGVVLVSPEIVPVYKKGWFWGIVGVVAGVVTTAVITR